MNIDWTKLVTAQEIEDEKAAANKVTISRTQGLIWLFRNNSIKDTDIIALLDTEEDEVLKYEAQKYFEAATWDSDNSYVKLMAEAVGIKDITLAFNEALAI